MPYQFSAVSGLQIQLISSKALLIQTRNRSHGCSMIPDKHPSPLTIYYPLILSSVLGSFSPFDVSVFLGYSRRTFIIAGKSPILSRNPDLLDTNHLTFPATYFCWALGFIGTQVRHSPANHICRHHEFIFSSVQSSSGPLLGPPASTIDVRRTMQLAALNPRGPRSGSPATVLTTLDSCDSGGDCCTPQPSSCTVPSSQRVTGALSIDRHWTAI
ncbi:hypothetical protein B0H11DRAFT_2096015 [Mycena galericulata]|nr:hypothetical protein B0H11DRAFT_2096015 [Mycena galericulata]